MKKLNLLILVFATIFIACNKDDDTSNEETSSNLVGTWELTYRKQSNNTSASNLDDCEKTSTFNFKSDNTYIEKTFVEISSNCVSDGEFNGSWSISSNQLTLKFVENGENTTNIPKYSITDNELSIIYNDEGILIESRYKKK